MKKSGFEKRQIIALLLTIIIIFLILSFLFFPKLIGLVIQEHKKQVQFYFYDEFGCPLNGYVFIGEQLIGKTNKGWFNLTYSNYKENFQDNKNISLFGKLGSCFNVNSDLLFDKYWESFKIEEYYFEGDSVFNFKTKVNPNNPSKRELLGFIQPDKIKSELNNTNLNNKDTLEALLEINNFLNNKITYREDWDFNKETNYWQTPEETSKIKQGDCEDYSTTLLSLFLAYNSSLNCYNVVFTSHVTTLCHINNYYIYYDQGKTELKKQINKENLEETKTQLIKLKQDYFKHYGIDKNNETETKAHYAFNDNNYIELKDEEDFINWQYSLDKKSESDIFEELEKQAIKVQEKYSTEGKLATEKPSIASTLATEKPTLKGFITENPIMIVSLSIIFVVLIIILIKINKNQFRFFILSSMFFPYFSIFLYLT